jgi:hypothetical protein
VGTGNYILDAEGNPVEEPDLMKWATWYEGRKADERVGGSSWVVALDYVGEARVSTVFLALDHSYRDDGPPLLFETMVFGGRDDMWQDRYATREGALAGHAEAVEMVRRGRGPFRLWLAGLRRRPVELVRRRLLWWRVKRLARWCRRERVKGNVS